MNRTKIAKDAMAHYDKVHANDSSEARNFYISGWLDGIQELTSLVKRMRDAQKEWLNINPFEDEEMEDVLSRIRQYESEVDEYLKKMEE